MAKSAPKAEATKTQSKPKTTVTSPTSKPSASSVKPKSAAKAITKAKSVPASTEPVKLLTGGNPQIAKADGDAAVQMYIAAMPGWKRSVGERLDAIIVRAIPDVQKAVRWNSPFYGLRDQGWFLGIHCITKYVKVAFFRGSSLTPMPPVESKQKEVRYFHVYENEPLDEKSFESWVKQASKLPGEPLF